jgi:ornithine carbamoyltransferase
MFLGKDDIQLGINETFYDPSLVISSMTSCMVARVGPHSDVADLAKYSAVPVINALSDLYHTLQPSPISSRSTKLSLIDLPGSAWKA